MDREIPVAATLYDTSLFRRDGRARLRRAQEFSRIVGELGGLGAAGPRVTHRPLQTNSTPTWLWAALCSICRSERQVMFSPDRRVMDNAIAFETQRALVETQCRGRIDVTRPIGRSERGEKRNDKQEGARSREDPRVARAHTE